MEPLGFIRIVETTNQGKKAISSSKLVEHRDLKAAKKILVKGLGLESTAGHAKNQRLGEISSLASTEKSVGVKVDR